MVMVLVEVGLTGVACVCRRQLCELCRLRLLHEDRTGAPHGVVSLPGACARRFCGYAKRYTTPTCHRCTRASTLLLPVATLMSSCHGPDARHAHRYASQVESRIRRVSWLRRRLYGKVYGSKLAAMKAGAYQGRPGEPPLRCPAGVPGLAALGAAVERLAFRRIRAALGGRLR